MLKLYCQKCGGLNNYVSEKPNFCQKCGTSFGPSVENAQANIIDEEDEELNTKNATLDLSGLHGLDVEIVASTPRSETVGGLAGTAEEGYNPESMPLPEQPYTMEDFKREAGQQRGGNEQPEET